MRRTFVPGATTCGPARPAARARVRVFHTGLKHVSGDETGAALRPAYRRMSSGPSGGALRTPRVRKKSVW